MNHSSDLGTFLAMVLGLLAAVAAGVVVFARSRSRRQDNDKIERERRTALQRAVEAGTHLVDGSPRCRLAGCSLGATHHPFRIVRDEGLWDTLRRAFGAPPRYRVARDPWRVAYCESHAHLVRQVVNVRLLRYEQDRAEALRDFEVALGEFERVGLDAEVAKLAQPKRRRSAADAKVVSLAARAGGAG